MVAANNPALLRAIALLRANDFRIRQAAGLLIPALHTLRDAHQQEQVALTRLEAALIAGGTVVGDESE
jgi:hypothetical protein